MNNNLIEGKFGHGAIPINPLWRKVRRIFRSKVGKGTTFDWATGYDVRDTIGPIIIKNQGVNFSCGGQAGSYFLEIQRRLQGIKEGDCSAKSVYAPIAYPGGGTTIDSLETQIGTRGSNLEAAVPSYYITGQPLSEAMMIDMSWDTPSMQQDALQRAGYTPYDIGTDIDNVASAIQAYGAVIWEIKGKSNGTWISAYPQPPLPGNPNPFFAHFMCAIGAKMINGQKTIIALESMGIEQGDQGIQYFQENYFNSGYILDVFTLIYDKKITSLPVSMPIWVGLLQWFKIFLSSLQGNK